MNGKRDCKNCIHKVPVFDEEEGIWRGADCDSWECNFVSRAEALKAYEELREAKEVLETIKERYILLEKSPRDNPNDLLVAKMPERPQGDLISREALKQVFSNLASDDYNEPIWYQKTVFETIDNAPTVNFIISPDYVTELQNLNKELIKQLEEAERTQSEWIDTGDMQEYWAEEYQCSICGAKDHWHNYCPNCGADMRKGDKEE